MTVQSASSSPNLGKDIADVGRGLANAVFSPFSLLSEGIDDIVKRLKFNKEKELIEPPTPQTFIRDVKGFFIDYHRTVLLHGAVTSKKVEEGTKKLLERCLSWLTFFEIGKMVHDVVSGKMATLAGLVTFAAIQVLHAVPYLAASALITGMALLYQASPIGLLCAIEGTILAYHLGKSYFEIKGIGAAINILQNELDVDKVRDKAELGIQIGAVKVNNWFHEWLQTTRPINWFTSGPVWQRGIVIVGTLGTLAGIDHYTSPLIAIATLVGVGAMLYKPPEKPQIPASEANPA